MKKPGLCTQNTPTYSCYSVYLHYCIRFTNSVHCIRFPMEQCLMPCIFINLFNIEIQNYGQILCAHKPYLLMPGHNYCIIAIYR